MLCGRGGREAGSLFAGRFGMRAGLTIKPLSSHACWAHHKAAVLSCVLGSPQSRCPLMRASAPPPRRSLPASPPTPARWRCWCPAKCRGTRAGSGCAAARKRLGCGSCPALFWGAAPTSSHRQDSVCLVLVSAGARALLRRPALLPAGGQLELHTLVVLLAGVPLQMERLAGHRPPDPGLPPDGVCCGNAGPQGKAPGVRGGAAIVEAGTATCCAHGSSAAAAGNAPPRRPALSNWRVCPCRRPAPGAAPAGTLLRGASTVM